MKKVIQTVLILLLSLFALGAENFVINAYDIAITVNENSSMHVKETILADFTEASHGLYRDIQYRFSNPDGNFADPVRATVSNITSADLHEVEKEDGNYRIYLGDEDEYVEGEKEYVIEYDYDLGRDLYDDHDELYYNIISPAWDTKIWNITWSVTFPKALDGDRIWVTYGEEGSTTEGNFTLSQDRKTISGKQSGLKNYGGITLRVEMDEGYWVGIEERVDNSTPYLYYSIVLTLVLLVITVIVWRLFGTDRPLNPVATSEIPESLSPMELRYIIEDGKKNAENDLGAMVIYWADRGFIKLTGKEEEKGKKKYNDYLITKLRDLPENAPEAEKELFSLVVSDDGNTFTGLGKDGFTDKYDSKVGKKLSEEFGKGERRLKRKLSSVLEGILLVLYLIAAIADGILLSLKFPGILSILFALLLIVLFAASSFTGNMFQARKAYWKKKQKRAAVIEMAVITFLVIGFCVFLIWKARLNCPEAVVAAVIDSLAIAFGSFLASHVEQKTKYGHDILEKCLVVRKFIEECKDKESYNSLLPYASALGLGESWSEKYRDTVITNPQWYEGEWDDDFFCFYLFFHHTMNHAYSTGHSDYSSSSSSGSVGGGFSGGGGGSW